jgi:cbb3-type cytochrome oxidase subunit 3
VNLGWERQKLFLGFNPVIATLAATLATHAPFAARIGLLTAALVSIAGILVVWRSHGRYRATRAHMQSLEKALAIPGLETTGGMRVERGEPRFEGFKVVTVQMTILGVLAALEVGFALAL